MTLNHADIKKINKLNSIAPFLKWRKQKNIYQGYMEGQFPYKNHWPRPGEDKIELRQQKRVLLEVFFVRGSWYVRVFDYMATNDNQSLIMAKATGSWFKRTVKKALKMEADFRKVNGQDSMIEWAAKRPDGQLSLTK